MCTKMSCYYNTPRTLRKCHQSDRTFQTKRKLSALTMIKVREGQRADWTLAAPRGKGHYNPKKQLVQDSKAGKYKVQTAGGWGGGGGGGESTVSESSADLGGFCG